MVPCNEVAEEARDGAELRREKWKKKEEQKAKKEKEEGWQGSTPSKVPTLESIAIH